MKKHHFFCFFTTLSKSKCKLFQKIQLKDVSKAFSQISDPVSDVAQDILKACS